MQVLIFVFQITMNAKLQMEAAVILVKTFKEDTDALAGLDSSYTMVL